jgi:hypothetical protein
MTRTLGLLVSVGITLSSAIPAAGQWLNHPTRGIPRTSDGRADLGAPPPRTADGHPDLSGIWGWQPGRFIGPITQDLKPEEIRPWARTLAAQRIDRMGQDDPSNYDCLPQGPRLYLYAPIPAKIVQTPGLVLILSEDLTYRQIFLDGRDLPKDPDPSFMGYSVGRWDGDTLVVETIGYKDRTWLDFAGMPHSEKLRITERIRGSRGLRQALHRDAGRTIHARYRAARIHLRGERAQPPSLHRHGVRDGQGEPGASRPGLSGSSREVCGHLRFPVSREPEHAAPCGASPAGWPVDDCWWTAAHPAVGHPVLLWVWHVRCHPR